MGFWVQYRYEEGYGGQVQYSTVQCSTVQYSTVQYSTVQYSAVQYSAVQYSTVVITPIHFYNNQVSLGINGAPFSPDYAILRWTDTSTTALKAVKVRRGEQVTWPPALMSTFSTWASPTETGPPP